MGSGASFDTNNFSATDSERYYCHTCYNIFGDHRNSFSLSNGINCPHCRSNVIEKMNNLPLRNMLPVTTEQSTQLTNPLNLSTIHHRYYDGVTGSPLLRYMDEGNLTTNQVNRLNNATVMLQLLEYQLREELEQLQHLFESTSHSMNRSGGVGDIHKPKLTKIMKGKLRKQPITLDLLCSQPSCPICSEDFQVCYEATKLPCTHLFHPQCISPWLDMKQNCPICRMELSNNIPTIKELELLSNNEIIVWIEDLTVHDTKQTESEPIETFQERKDSNEDLEILTKNELIIKLQKLLNEYVDKEDEKNNYNRNYLQFQINNSISGVPSTLITNSNSIL